MKRPIPLADLLHKSTPETHGSGIGLPGGSRHYRAYVGPPHYYDLMAAMAFNLVTLVGLRQEHRFLDIGCGSLRMGRLLIPYLNPGRYIGVEPNQWLIKDGALNELGGDIGRVKTPAFIIDTRIDGYDLPAIDYTLAQSIFTHCATDQISDWLVQIHQVLARDGVLLATYFQGEEDYAGSGWIYPDCAFYRAQTIQSLVEAAGFAFYPLDWRHPRKQRWFAACRKGFDTGLIDGELHWNHYIDRLPPG